MGHFLQSERTNGARGKELKKEKGGGDGPGFNRKRGEKSDRNGKKYRSNFSLAVLS